ncbi:MAG: NADH-quinone oxidoreductase subunit N [Ignavibacteriales bacterium]|nr:NADH-quinone oxidoreductase subunit N [Ignavibacteriales bacterium]
MSVIIEMYSNKSENILPWFSLFLFTLSAIYALYSINSVSVVFQNMINTGGNVNLFYFIFCSGSAIVTLLSISYLKKYGAYFGEYFILLQTSVLGMMLMAAARDLFVVFLGLEIMSVSFYVLAGLNRKRLSANEASLKYFLLGAFATGFLVYGIALIYGSVHTTSIQIISSKFADLSANILFMGGILLFLIGFSFKIAAFPFHMWVPDVYQGAPTTVSALFSTGGKAAAFSAIMVVLAVMFTGSGQNQFTPYLAVISTLSMLYGSIVAIAQTDIKRMLAYSSIAHAGYMIIGLSAGNALGVAGIIFYLAAYTFINLGAFGVVSIIEGEDESNLTIDSYSGLNKKVRCLQHYLRYSCFPWLASLPLQDFFGKYYVFIAAIKADLTWLAILGVFQALLVLISICE